jgi:Toprim domain-containing protein
MNSAFDAQHIAQVFGGDVINRHSVLIPGPGHSPADRSLSIKADPSARGGLIVHSFANDDWKDCRDYVLGRLGVDWKASSKRPRVISSQPDMKESALRLWRETIDIDGTPAQLYLRSRKIELPASALDVRFHPSCPFGTDRHPCIVALYRDIRTNEPRAIHRTAISSTGEKIDRKALGPKGRCAIKFSPDDDVHGGLTISEGIETALAGMALGFRPAWALGDAGEIGKFPVLPGVECLTILVDNDDTGRARALECSQRWTADGREVFRVIPAEVGSDMADIIRGRAA